MIRLNIYLLKRWISRLLSRSHRLSYSLEFVALYFGKKRHRLVSSESKLVIEGPARCGNSSALRLVIENNPELKKRVATHIHKGFQVVYADRLNVPCITMLRSPLESVVSHAGLLSQLDQVRVDSDKQRRRLLKCCLKDYINFVECIGKRAIVVGFEAFINNPDSLIDYINARSDLNLSSSRAIKQSDLPVHVLPNKDRDAIKTHYREIIRDCANIQRIADRAQKLYIEKLSYR